MKDFPFREAKKEDKWELLVQSRSMLAFKQNIRSEWNREYNYLY